MGGCSLETHEIFLAMDQNHSIETTGTCSYSLTKSKEDTAREITKLDLELFVRFVDFQGGMASSVFGCEQESLGYVAIIQRVQELDIQAELKSGKGGTGRVFMVS